MFVRKTKSSVFSPPPPPPLPKKQNKPLRTHRHCSSATQNLESNLLSQRAHCPVRLNNACMDTRASNPWEETLRQHPCFLSGHKAATNKFALSFLPMIVFRFRSFPPGHPAVCIESRAAAVPQRHTTGGNCIARFGQNLVFIMERARCLWTHTLSCYIAILGFIKPR